VKLTWKTGLLLVGCVLISAGDVSADYMRSFGQQGEEDTAQSAPRRYSVSGKLGYHTFWKTGLLENGDAYGRPGLGVGNLAGLAGEIEFNYKWRPFLVFAATLGGYQGKTDQYNIDIFTGYVLGTAKLQKSGRIADYYLGAGIGAYFSRMKAEGTSTALKPGFHGLIGITFHVTRRWDIVLEDRMAFTVHAEEGFGDLDLGGNFVLLGCAYNF
jgi:hypothetical protein